jgi:hypothetical protein
MGTVKFLDDPPFDLELAKPGKAGAVTTNVWATLPVFSLGPHRELREIHLKMSIGQARALARDLAKAAGVADMHERGASR